MPLYEYQCDACGHRFEVIQKYSDPHIEVCPKCGGTVKKLLSSPAIQFKGTGWYITDYARSGKSEGGVSAGKNESGGSSEKADKKSEGSSESKSESKSDSSSSDSKAESKSESKTESKTDSKT